MRNIRMRCAGAFVAALLLVGISTGCNDKSTPQPTAAVERDPHSFAHPDEVAVKHLELDLGVDFESKTLAGTAALDLVRTGDATKLLLDARDLVVERVTLDGSDREAAFTLGDNVEFLGQSLEIALEPQTKRVVVHYRTSPHASAVQWLDPEQTAGKKSPFLFTQSQAILARTWVPCQDTPGVRMTYAARIRTRPDLMAVMSASNPTQKSTDGVYTFEMKQAIPSYLLALAVGDLEFRSVGPRTGVYAEPSVVEKAAWEFSDVEKMMSAAEALYGPYRWERYDLIVLPPSFPYGGMENPRLTFATPTILAGDRSLVSLVAHELAHSWSGNLVTNADWNDFWLNEGFTTYFERRIMEAITSRDYEEMLATLGLQDLQKEIGDPERQERDTWLQLDLAGRDPDDGMNDVAYEKGCFFLRLLEESVGREKWDAYLRGYFDRHAFQSMTTARFLADLRANLIAGDAALEERLQIERWVHGPGLPDNAPQPVSGEFARVEAQAAAWQGGKPARELDTANWTTHHWLHFLNKLPETLAADRMQDLDATFGFTKSKNSEVLAAWLERSIKNNYAAANPALEEFLTGMGRRKFLRPLYKALAATPEGKEQGRRIYAKARSSYHAVSRTTIDEILSWEAATR